MDFKSRILYPFPEGSMPLGQTAFPSGAMRPFYMSYPGYGGMQQERLALQDLEYLQQTYPDEVRRYRRKVAEILDKMDYEGSMIYDEYPDCYSVRRLAQTITRIMRQEEEAPSETENTQDEKWNMVENLVLVLLSNEIFCRRHGGRRDFFKF